jgi:hypothetical protein
VITVTHLQPGYHLCRLGHISVIPTVISLHLQSHILMVDGVSPMLQIQKKTIYREHKDRTDIDLDWTDSPELGFFELVIESRFISSFSSLSPLRLQGHMGWRYFPQPWLNLLEKGVEWKSGIVYLPQCCKVMAWAYKTHVSHTRVGLLHNQSGKAILPVVCQTTCLAWILAAIQ